MANNPYTDLLSVMRTEGSKYNPPSLQLATVISVAPLLLKIGDLQLNKNNFLIAEHLLQQTRKISFNSSVNGSLTAGGYSGSLSNLQIEDKEMLLKSILNINDTVAVLSIDEGQTYIILEKVVKI